MRSNLFAVLALTGLTACSRGNLEAAPSDAGRNPNEARTDTVAAWEDRSLAPNSRTLNTGSRITATWTRSITSRTNKAGETIKVIVTADARDERGRVVIPSGAIIDVHVADLAPATTSRDMHGTFALNVTSTTIRDRTYFLFGAVTVPHSLKARVGKDVATKSAPRDVVVSVGSRVLITLSRPFTIAGL